MKLGFLSFVVLSFTALGLMAYHRVPRQEALRDALKDTGFNIDVNEALKGDKKAAVSFVKGKSSIETVLEITEPPSDENVRKAFEYLRQANQLFDAAGLRGGQSRDWRILVDKARQALREKQVVKSFGAQVYCGRLLQFKQSDSKEGACHFSRPDSICYKGNIEEAQDLILFATGELDYWKKRGVDSIHAQAVKGKLLMDVLFERTGYRGLGGKMPIEDMEVIPCQ